MCCMASWLLRWDAMWCDVMCVEGSTLRCDTLSATLLCVLFFYNYLVRQARELLRTCACTVVYVRYSFYLPFLLVSAFCLLCYEFHNKTFGGWFVHRVISVFLCVHIIYKQQVINNTTIIIDDEYYSAERYILLHELLIIRSIVHCIYIDLTIACNACMTPHAHCHVLILINITNWRRVLSHAK